MVGVCLHCQLFSLVRWFSFFRNKPSGRFDGSPALAQHFPGSPTLKDFIYAAAKDLLVGGISTLERWFSCYDWVSTLNLSNSCFPLDGQ